MSSGATTHPASQATKSRDEALEGIRRQLEAAVRSLCPAWMSASRDDIVQLALIRVHNLPGEHSGALSSSYLWKVAYSVTVDEIRRQRRRPEDGLETVESAEVSQPTPGPEQRALGHALGRTIRQCLAGLSKDRRLAVILHLQGHPLRDAAQLLGWPAKRVANLTYRGLDDLRQALLDRGIRL